MNKEISLQTINEFKEKFKREPRYRLAQNALLRADTKTVTMNADQFLQLNHSFSDIVSDEMKATAQQKSGRCWIFAALNIIRHQIAKKYKLEDFELSQNYLFFFDKFEKANYFLENIVETANDPFDSRIVSHLLSNPVQDGGQWHMLVNLVNKYGLVPKAVFPDTGGCADSKELNALVTTKLRDNAVVLRKMVTQKASKNDIAKEKHRMMGEIYRILSMLLGTPPEKFDWEVRSKDQKFLSEYGITPHAFAKKYNPLPLNSYLALVHSPREHTPLHKTYTIQYLGNVVEGHPILYINVSPQEMKEAIIASIKQGEAVWFGCDVGKSFHRDLGVMQHNLYDVELFYDIKMTMTKADRMNYGESQMTHAMVFTGVNLVKGKPTRWRVENSWGQEVGSKGYFIMTDEWFDEFMFEIAINPKYLPAKLSGLAKLPPIILPPWDPLGALASTNR